MAPSNARERAASSGTADTLLRAAVVPVAVAVVGVLVLVAIDTVAVVVVGVLELVAIDSIVSRKSIASALLLSSLLPFLS